MDNLEPESVDQRLLSLNCRLTAQQLVIDTMLTHTHGPFVLTVLEAFKISSEANVSSMLVYAQRDATVHAQQAAFAEQLEMLERLAAGFRAGQLPPA